MSFGPENGRAPPGGEDEGSTVSVTAIAAAVSAECSFATAAILQQEAAQTVDRSETLRLRLLLTLMRWRHLASPPAAGRREWIGIGIVLVLCGVSTFLVAAAPASGIAQPDLAYWLRTLVAAGIVVTAAVLVAKARRGPWRASLLGAAAGVCFALLAVLTKGVTHQLRPGQPDE